MKKSNKTAKSTRRHSGAVRIYLPPHAKQKLGRAFAQLENYGAACLWCGHGYDEFNATAEDEHFATCPNAPEELRENAKRRLLRQQGQQFQGE